MPDNKNGKTENKKIVDPTEVRIIGIYMVQKLTYPTLNELKRAIKEKLNCIVHKSTLKRAMDGAKSAGFVAVALKPNEDGRDETAYKMKNLSWSQPPEYAHIKDLLPVLMRTPEAMKIKEYFDGHEGEAGTKKKRGNLIDNFHAFRVKAILLEPLLGSQIACEYTHAVREEFPTNIEDNNVEVDGIWHRDQLTGDYILTSDALQGWFKTNACRYMGLQDSKADYVAFSPVFIRPKHPVYQLVLPVNTTRGVSAPKPYETISAGEEIVFNFVAPTKGVLSSEQYEEIFVIAGLRPRRGISPARGKRFGRFLVTSFEDLGEIRSPGSVTNLLDVVPPNILEEHGAYLRDAVTRFGKKSKKDVDKKVDDIVHREGAPWDNHGVAAE